MGYELPVMSDSDDLEDLLGNDEEEEVEKESDNREQTTEEEDDEIRWLEEPLLVLSDDDEETSVIDCDDRDEEEIALDGDDEEEEEEHGKMEKVKSSSASCILCKQRLLPDLRLGALYRLQKISAHHFCLILASGLHQVGEEDEGILGFLLVDIQKEVKRGASLRCYHCKEFSATVGCCSGSPSCHKSFHLPCLLRSGGLPQYFGSFTSYCSEHRPLQKVPEAFWKTRGSAPKFGQCGVCLEKLPLRPGGKDSLWTPCCQGWFHRSCVDQLTDTAGSQHAKCPLCSDKEMFQKEMLRCGVYIPDREAKWEMEEEAYCDLYTRHDTCDALECVCPHGRLHDEVDTDWELVLCELCGAQGVHAACARLDNVNLRWKCSICQGALRQEVKEQKKEDPTPDKKEEWEVDNDTDSGEEEVEEEASEDEISDAAVFEKCLTSTEDHVWSAVTCSWTVNIPKLDLEKSKLNIGNRETIVKRIRERNQSILTSRKKLCVRETSMQDKDNRNSQDRQEIEDIQDMEEFDEGKLVKCDLCMFQCESQAGLDRHGRLHDPSRPFACSQCGLRFLKERHVRVHSRTHTGERPYRCDFCETDFSEAWRLQLHMAKHDERRKYSCDHCSLRFKTKLALKAHMKNQHCSTLEEKKTESSGLSSSLSSSTTSLPVVSSVTSLASYGQDLFKPFRLKLKKPRRNWLELEDSGTEKENIPTQSDEEESDEDFYDFDDTTNNDVIADPSTEEVNENKEAVKKFSCDQCDFKSSDKSTFVQHVENEHCQSEHEECEDTTIQIESSDSEEYHPVNRKTVVLESKSPNHIIVDRLVGSMKSENLRKFNKNNVEFNKSLKRIVMSKKKPKTVKKEYWVPLDGLRRPVRVIEEVDADSVLSDENEVVYILSDDEEPTVGDNDDNSKKINEINSSLEEEEEEIVRNNATKITSDLGFFMITTEDNDKVESLEDNINEKYSASNSCRVNIEKLVINQTDNILKETNMMNRSEKEADFGADAKIQGNIKPFFVNTSIPLKEIYSMSLKTSQCKVNLLRLSLPEADMLYMADVLRNMETNEKIPSSSQSESELKNADISRLTENSNIYSPHENPSFSQQEKESNNKDKSFPESSKTQFKESSCISKMETSSSQEELETKIVPLRIDLVRIVLSDNDRAYLKEVINNMKTIEDNLSSIQQENNFKNEEERSPSPEYSNIMDLIGSDSDDDEDAIVKEDDLLTLDDMTTQKMPPPTTLDPELQNLFHELEGLQPTPSP